MDQLKMEIAELTETLNNRLDTLEEKLQGLVEINSRLVHENISRGSSSPKATKKDSENGDTIIIENHGNGIKVTGKTYNHRSLFRENGGTWNKSIQAWIFPAPSKKDLVDVLNSNNIEFKEN